MKKNVFLTFVFLITLSCFAQNYTAYKMFRPPVIDGKLDDPVWEYMAEKRGFFKFKSRIYVLERETKFRIGHKDGKLYLGIHCGEPLPEKIIAHDNTRDGLWSDDAIEFFFLPAGTDNYMQIVINAKGVIWAKREKDLNTTNAEKVGKAKAYIGKNFWSVEAEIPFEVLDPWKKCINGGKFLIGRTVMTGSDADRLSSWPAVGSRGYGSKECFANMSFSRMNGSATEDTDLNAEYDSFFFNELAKVAKSNPTPAEISKYGHTDEFKKQENLRKEIRRVLFTLKHDKNKQKAYYKRWIEQKYLAQIISRKLDISIETIDCNAIVKINGVPVKNGSAVIREGISVITVETESTGAAPRFRIMEKDLSGNWKYYPGTSPAILKPEWNDSSWKVAEKKDGWISAQKGRTTFRQLIIWNETPFGAMSTLWPQVKTWEFPQGALEVMLFHVYSPFKHTWKNYEQRIDLPEGMEILNPVKAPSWGNWSPKSIRQEKITRDGKPYIRYILSYDVRNIPAGTAYYNYIPVKHISFGKPGDKFNIYLSRRANGNVSEIESVLPAKIIPPINGGKLKKLKIQFYTSAPYLHGAGTTATPREAEEIYAAAVKAGGNQFIIGCKKPYFAEIAKICRELGANVILNSNNYPVWGATIPGELEKLLRKPGFECRGFNGDTWELGRATKGRIKMYCPSKVLGDGKKEFLAAVKADFETLIKQSYPCDGIFMNWEQFVFPAKGRRGLMKGNGDGAYCFCQNCKKEFGTYKNISGAENLSDDEIYRKYKDQFIDFRYHQSAKIHGLIRDVILSMGLSDIFYCQTANKAYWKNAAGSLDQLFVGCPGNPSANAKWQKFIDDSMEFFRTTVKKDRFIGQRFTYFTSGYNVKESWKKGWVLSDSGILEPHTWKNQMIRMFASVHGGVDLGAPYTLVSGINYYIGEATRLVAEYEDYFYQGKRNDKLADSKQIAYPDLLVLTLGDNRLVLAFNETDQPKQVTIRNLKLKPGQKGIVCNSKRKLADPSNVSVIIPPHDVIAINIFH